MNDYAALGLEPTASSAEVKAAWREIARRLHPDLGGDPDAFNRAHSSYAAALADATHRESICQTCQGKKKITQTHGWTTIYLRCPTCG